MTTGEKLLQSSNLTNGTALEHMLNLKAEAEEIYVSVESIEFNVATDIIEFKVINN